MQVDLLYSSNFQDVNECKAKTHQCKHHCINNLGSYSCGCRIGYALAADGKSCNRKYTALALLTIAAIRVKFPCLGYCSFIFCVIFKFHDKFMDNRYNNEV